MCVIYVAIGAVGLSSPSNISSLLIVIGGGSAIIEDMFFVGGGCDALGACNKVQGGVVSVSVLND